MDEKSPLPPLHPAAPPTLISCGPQDRIRARRKVWAITGTGGAVAAITIGALGVGLAPSITTSAAATTTPTAAATSTATTAAAAASPSPSAATAAAVTKTTTPAATTTNDSAVSGSGGS